MTKVSAPLFDQKDLHRAFVPTAFRRAVACSGGPGRPSGRRGRALPWAAANPAAGWRGIGIGVLLAALAPAAVSAAPPRVSPDLSAWIGEASVRFDLPPRLIGGVMRRESAFRPSAVSSAGALGLMQVMPSTYQALSRRYGLGPDPLAPRDNVLAGAAYLRELYDRFGGDGFLAAYNAGPNRYMRSLIDGSALPSETRRYVGQLQNDLGLGGHTAPPPTVFVALSPDLSSTVGRSPQPAPAGGLFASIISAHQEAGDAR